MGLRINTNVAGIGARRRLERNATAVSDNYMHLATGKRIAKAADDASGTAISGRMAARIRAMKRATSNAQDGLSLTQTTEGGLREIHTALVRMRELAVRSANGTQTPEDRDALQNEVTQLVGLIDQVSSGTTFNTIDLLSSGASVTLQIGSDTRAGLDTLRLSLTAVDSTSLGVGTTDIGASGDASAAIGAIDGAIDTVGSQLTDLGAAMNRISSVIANNSNHHETHSGLRSRIVDVDIARETAQLTRNEILKQAAVSTLAQANAQPELAVNLLG